MEPRSGGTLTMRKKAAAMNEPKLDTIRPRYDHRRGFD